jgi:hypothetical protein
VLSLDTLGVFDEFTALAKANEPVVENVLPGQPGKPMPIVPPLLQCRSGPVYRALFDVDFSKTPTQLANEFKEWLRLPENQERLQKHKRAAKLDTGKPLDRLKDLAAWRLHREENKNVAEAEGLRRNGVLFNKLDAANKFANAHRKRLNPKEQRPFRDAKPLGKGKIPANEAPLFGEEADAYEAQASAWAHLAEIMPDDKFRPLNESMVNAFVQLDKLDSQER